MFQVIIILGILVILAVQSYLPGRAKARVISITGGFDTVKRDGHVHYAMHGKWPENMAQTLESGILKDYSDLERQHEIDIKDGAVTFTFDRSVAGIAGKKITLRPVVQADDPFGPVHWICGNKMDGSAWIVSGEDQTTIEDKYIPRSLR